MTLNKSQIPESCLASVSGSTFVNADCFDVFPLIKDNSIDAIICDLPYGTTQCKWDSVLPFDKIWKEYKRVIKPNGAIILMCGEPFTSQLINSNLTMFKYKWIWDKKFAGNFVTANKRPLNTFEEIVIFYNNQPTYNPQMTKGKFRNKSTSKPQSNKGNYGEMKHQKDNFNDDYYPTSILDFTNANVRARIHPTEKQLPLMEYLVKTYTNEGDMVLDNTMGSGTTNLACIKLNRKSIGIEKEKQYYDVAVRRASEYCH